jgi:hypothetical protein
MRNGTRTSLILLCFAVVVSVFPMWASALIEFSEGNAPVENQGWPDGSEAVANLPERFGEEVGPPFGGGEYCFRYHCKDTAQFNAALAKFGAIHVPRTSRVAFSSFAGENPRLDDPKSLLLVVHDRPKVEKKAKPKEAPIKSKDKKTTPAATPTPTPAPT